MKKIIYYLKQNFIFISLSQFIFLFLASQIFTSSNSNLKWISYTLAIICLIVSFVFVLHIKRRKAISKSLFSLVLVFFIFSFLANTSFILQQFFLNYNNPNISNNISNALQIIYYIFIPLSITLGLLIQGSHKALGRDNNKAFLLRNIMLNLSILLIFLVGLQFLAYKNPLLIDMTTLGRFSLSEKAKPIIHSIDQKIKVSAFYPYFHEVHKEVELFLTDLASLNKNIEVKFYDALRERNTAVKKKINQNGQILFETFDTKETKISDRLRRRKVILGSLSDLREMEKKIVSAIISITSKRKNIYFSLGHNEISNEGLDKQNIIAAFQKHLRLNNFNAKELTPQTGFPEKIPQDIDVLAIINPTKKFSKKEQKTILNYLLEGGKALLSLDINDTGAANFILERFAISYNKKRLVTDFHVPPIKDNLMSATYTSHAITQYLTKLKNSQRVSMYPGTGSLDVIKAKQGLLPAGFNPNFFIRSDFRTWFDENNNNQLDKKTEKQSVKNIAVALSYEVSKKNKYNIKNQDKLENSRLLIFADSSFLTDKYIRFIANSYIAVNSIKWLSEDEKVMGMVPDKRQDGPIVLSPTAKIIMRIFIILLWPLMLGFGGYIYLKKRKKKLINRG